MPIHWGYALLAIFPFILGRINTKLTCMSYVIPVIYMVEKLLIYFQVIQESFHLEYQKLIVVVGVLHFAEGMLVFGFGGDRSQAVITYKGNDIAGGYQTYGRWIVPLLLFSVRGIYVPIFVCITYFNETFTREVNEKAEKMGLCIALFGILTLRLSQLYRENRLNMDYLMILMPAMHEGLFVVDQLLEKGKALYTYPKKGLRLMAFAKAVNMPKPFDWGDVILEINNHCINCEEDYRAALKSKLLFMHLKKVTGDEIYIIIKKVQLEALQPVFLPPQ